MAEEQEASAAATADPAADATATATATDTTATEPDPKATEAAQPADPPKAAEPADWRAGIQDQKVREWATQRFASAADAALMAYDARRKLSNAIIVPGKDATDEERAAYLKRIGVPEGDYSWQMPDGRQATDQDKLFQAEAGKVFKDLNISADQAKGLNAFWNALEKQSGEHAAKERDDHLAAQEAALRKEWGGDFDVNANIASQAWGRFGGTEDVENLKLEGGGRLGDHPALMKMFARIGRETSESPGIVGMSDTDVKSLAEKHRELTGQAIDARERNDKTLADRLSREASAISERLYGTGPAPGSSRAA